MLAVAAAVSVTLGRAGCGHSGGEKDRDADAAPAAAGATPSGAANAADAAAPAAPVPGCQPTPPPGTDAQWFPADLPIPPGTYTVQEVQVAQPSKAVVLVVPVSLRDYVKFALAEFPKQGWHLGKGDSEAGEAEDSFGKGNQGGSFRARSVYCDTTKTELRIVYNPDVTAGQH